MINLSNPDSPLLKRSVLVVEDDVRLADLIATYLRSNHFDVHVEHRGDGVVDAARRVKPDLIVLDLGLPGRDGLDICKELRQSFKNPILILTARNDDIDQILGLELGADDYVIKPVEPRVLLARINALLRRSNNASSQEPVLRFGRLTIDAASRSAVLDTQPIDLSSGEFDLLIFLATRAGQIQSREALYQHIFKREYDGLDRSLDVRISHLRRKLGDDADRPERIKTIWAQGYLFVANAW